MAERILPPEDSPYSSMEGGEVPSNARQAAKHFAENSPNDKEFEQELISDTVNALTRANELNNAHMAEEILDAAREYLEIRLPHKDWNMTRAGILAETCVRIGLKNERFEVKEPENDDDRNCIDLWIDPKEGGTVWTAQIKARSELEEPIVSRLRVRENGSLEDEIAMYPELYNEEVEIFARMSTYLESPKFSEIDIEPIVIWVPSGNREKEIMPAYKNNGEPSPGFSSQLYGRISRSFEWENDNG